MAACAALVLGPGRAAASTVTVGSPLTGDFSGSIASSLVTTYATTSLSEPGANATSPVSGTIVRWRTTGAFSGGTFTLRVLHPAGGVAYTAAGTSVPVLASGPGTQIWPTSLPIKSGDLIAITASANAHVGSDSTTSSSTVSYLHSPFADGATDTFIATFPATEAGFNADIDPTSAFSLGAIATNKKKGTATLNLTVPNAGTLTASGSGAQVTPAGAVSAGPVQLLVKATGKKKKALNSKGRVKLSITINYAPAGGDPSTQSLTVKLKKKL